MAAVSLFWDTNMSAVTSCGNTFLLKKKGKRWTFSRVQFNITKWQPPAVIFFVILACARVLLWRLAIALEQMLPAGEVYFRPVMSTNSQRKPRGGVDFLQRSTVFWILFFEFHKVCWIRFSTWESFIGFHLWGSPISMSLACLLSVTSEIEFRGKRGVGMRTMGAEMSSRASSSLVYYIVWRVNLNKLSRNKDNNK